MSSVLNNKKFGNCLVHLTANATLVVVGNNSVSNVAVSDETVQGASIRRVWFGSSHNGHWTVYRGSNTMLVLGGTGYLDFVPGNVLTKDRTANLVFTLNNTTTGFILAEIQKETSGTPSEYNR